MNALIALPVSTSWPVPHHSVQTALLENIPLAMELWMQIKVVSVSVLTYYHFLLGKYLNDFAIDNNSKSSKFYRIINEVPTITLIVVVFVVVYKPLS